MNRQFINFCVSLLYTQKSSYIFSAVMFMFIVFVLSAVIFISNSIRHDISQTAMFVPQITVQNQTAGRFAYMTDKHIDRLLMINGISDVVGRVDGYYYFLQADKYLHIVGEDDQSYGTMSISSSVADIFERFYYKDSFNFLSDDEKINITIDKLLPKSANIIANDIIVLNTQQAAEVLDIEDKYSYIEIFVPNDSEIEFISRKLKEIYPHTKITTKAQRVSKLNHLFYYKGGIFMILYIVVLVSFFVLLKNQINSTINDGKKLIAILRSIGFSIVDIIRLKLIQNSIVSVFAYIFGVGFAYIYVFIFDAPLLKNIFLGDSFIDDIELTPIVSFDLLLMLFLFTVVPFVASVILPSWKIAIGDMSEAMR